MRPTPSCMACPITGTEVKHLVIRHRARHRVALRSDLRGRFVGHPEQLGVRGAGRHRHNCFCAVPSASMPALRNLSMRVAQHDEAAYPP